MGNGSLIKKLFVKSGQKLVVLNSPTCYKLDPLPEGAELMEKLEGQVDFVQLFVKSSQELESAVPAIIRALKTDGLFWICYPKGGSKVNIDLNRDILWKAMAKFGMAGVSLVSLDDVWSAMRFRPADKVGK